MYQVSEALDKVISGSGRTFYARLNKISDGIQEIVQTNFSTPDSYFYVGGAIASKIEVSMFTKSQEFVKGTEVKLEIGAMADGAMEWIPMGYFTIKEQKKDRNLLTFTAYDRLESKLAKAYKSKITKYPAESKEFLSDISEQTGIEFDTSKLSDNLMVDKILTVNDQSGEKSYKEPFDGFTMQQVVGYIAQLHSTFAICDRNGKVTFRWYGALTTDHPGKIGDTAGSYLKDQNLSFIYNTIEFLKESHTYLIKTNRYFDDLLQSETMCQISGISCDTENDHYESGTNINTNLSNPVMTQEWLNKILEKIKDMSYYPVSFSFMGDPRLDVGDIVTIVDAKNNLIDVPVMQHTITFDGGLLSEVASYGFEEKEAKSPSQIALQRVKDDILTLQEITAKKATFNQLNAVDAKITNLQASSITVNDANILFARLDKANIEQGWITSVMIGDAQITNAKIQGMSADKLTAGTIDASIITVKNLDADSITVGKINWKQLSDDVNTTITDSKNTANNALNAANSSVQNVIIEYYSSTSKDQPVNGMWQTDSPDWVEGRYIWCRTKTVTKSGVISYSDASCITGNTGAKGDKGIPGINGENGQTTYLHIAYANSADGTSGFSTNDSTNKLYIGQYIDFIEEDSTLPSAYQWTKIKGDTGAKGEDGVSPIASVTKSGNVTTITITDKNGTHTQKVTDGTNGTPGASGADGRTSYFHAKYSNDGGKTFTANNGEATGDWIGTYTDFVEADSMNVGAYTWVKIKGDQGVKALQPTRNWTGTFTTIGTVQGAVIGDFNRTPVVGDVFLNLDGSSNTGTWEVTAISGANVSIKLLAYVKSKGADGKNGSSVTITSKSVTYQTSVSGVTVPSGTWNTDVPNVPNGQYLWTRTIVNYSDGTSITSYSVGYKGVNGSNGSNGKGVQSTSVSYQAWGNGTNTPTGGWSPTPLDTSADKPYLWTRTIITYTDGSSSTSYSVGSTLKGVSVGGRNLLKGTSKEEQKYNYPSGTDFKDVYNSNVTVPSNKGANTYTLSFWAKSTVNGDKFVTHFYDPSNVISIVSSQGYNTNAGDGRCPFTLSTTWTKYWVTYTVPEDGKARKVICPRLYGTGRGESDKGTGTLSFKGVKIELGNIATDWTPAPEDVDSGINNAQSTANSASSKADTAQNSANAAQSTANSASSKADTAQSSANAAQSTANSALSTANAAKKNEYIAFSGEGNSVGYFLIATLKVISNYINDDFILEANSRGFGFSRIQARFKSGNTTDPALESYKQEGDGNWYIAKTATSTWNIYCSKNEAWARCSVTGLSYKSGYISLTWGSGNASLPDNAIRATQMVSQAVWCYKNNQAYIDGSNLYASTVTADKIAARSISAEKMAVGTITAASGILADSVITNAKIADGAITNAKIANATIESAKIKSIDAAKITTGTITGLDAVFNRSFKVDSPYSDTDSFVIESSSNGVTIATRTKGVVSSTNDNKMFLGNDGLDIRCGTGPMRIWSNDILTIRTDSAGQINLEVQGLNSPNPPVYVKSDAGAFKIYHEGNFGSSASYKTGLKIGSITQGSSATDFYVPLATTSASGLISADEKKKINVDYLPKSGGTISNSNANVLDLNCTSGTMSTLRFYGSGKRLGSVGFNAQNSSLYRWNTSGTAYRILDENDLPLMTDSGWVNITLSSKITAVSYIGARVRKIGNIVNVVMGVTGATAAFQTLGTLAQGYRPSKEINLAARYYNSPTTAIAIGTDGAIKLLQTASGGSSYDASGAISFSITYFI